MSLLVSSIVEDMSLLGQLGGAEADQQSSVGWVNNRCLALQAMFRQGCADTGAICRGGKKGGVTPVTPGISVNRST